MSAKDGQLHISDIAYYGKDATGNELKNAVGTANNRRLMRVVGEYAKKEGYSSLRLSGTRVKNSSSANPGHLFDVTIKLK